MRIYLSGRMSGVPGHNYAAFDLAKAHLESLGFDVVSPADIGRHYGINEYSHVDRDTCKQLLLADLEAEAYCDAIFLLPGWEQSGGVDIEVRFGKYFGTPAFESVSDLLIYREEKAA